MSQEREQPATPARSTLHPAPVSLLLCERLIVDRRTNLVSLIDVFGAFPPAPAPLHFSFTVYAGLTDADGLYDFRLDVTHLASRRVVGQATFTGTAQPELSEFNVFFGLNRISLEAGQQYEITMYANNKLIARRTVPCNYTVSAPTARTIPPATKEIH